MGEIIAAIIVFLIARAVKGDKKKKKADSAPKAPVQPASPAKPAQPITKPAAMAAEIKSVAKEFVEEFADDDLKALTDMFVKEQPATKPAAAQPASKKTSIEIAMEAFKKREAPARLTLLEQEIAPDQGLAPDQRLAPDQGLAPGQSLTDEHGCIGGSLSHDSSEGETLHEHAGHEMRRQSRLAAEAQAVQPARRVTARDLRQAVVMSEILNRPKALRR